MITLESLTQAAMSKRAASPAVGEPVVAKLAKTEDDRSVKEEQVR